MWLASHPSRITAGEEPPGAIEWEAGWGPEPIWTFWNCWRLRKLNHVSKGSKSALVSTLCLFTLPVWTEHATDEKDHRKVCNLEGYLALSSYTSGYTVSTSYLPNISAEVSTPRPKNRLSQLSSRFFSVTSMEMLENSHTIGNHFTSSLFIHCSEPSWHLVLQNK